MHVLATYSVLHTALWRWPEKTTREMSSALRDQQRNRDADGNLVGEVADKMNQTNFQFLILRTREIDKIAAYFLDAFIIRILNNCITD